MIKRTQKPFSSGSPVLIKTEKEMEGLKRRTAAYYDEQRYSITNAIQVL